MTQNELKMVLEALELCNGAETVEGVVIYTDKAITAIKEALAQPEQEPVVGTKTWFEDGKVVTQHLTAKDIYKEPEQEPVAWLLTDKNINSLQVDSIQRLIDRAKHAHHTDLCVRINGQDELFEADWLKHMVRATPPQRTWVVFPTMLRKMWSGSEVQAWLDENVNKEKNT